MEQNKENLMELINEFRKWNEEWMANPSIKVRSLKSVDEFAENLSEKYTLIKKKQSSIDWLVQQIWKNEPLEHEQKVIEQAKAMHKEEIVDAWRNGLINRLPEEYYNESFQYYYNETFGGENE